MTISRSQQPRQMYGLGSLVKSVKKAVKNVVKSPIGKAALLYGATLPFGGPMAAAKGLGGFFMGGKTLPPSMGFKSKGLFGTLASKFKGMSALGKAGVIGGASLLGGLFAGKTEEEIEELKRNPETLKVYLRDYYTRLNPNASSEEVDAFVTTNTAEYYSTGGRVGYQQGSQPAQQLGSPQGGTSLYGDVLEYLQRSNMPSGQAPKQVVMDDMGGGVMSAYSGAGSFGGTTGASTTPISTGGGSSGTGILQATPGMTQPVTTPPSNVAPTTPGPDAQLQKEFQNLYDLQKDYLAELNKGGTYGPYVAELYRKGSLERANLSDEELYQSYLKDAEKDDLGLYIPTLEEYIKDIGYDKYKTYDEYMRATRGYNKGGNVVDQASGIMGLPKRTNSAGVKELDLRKSGGFIPPVGVKEKADDIPAMLSNNEFVFTADAVRGMGDGDVNKGAQRMYTMMKRLEKGGRA